MAGVRTEHLSKSFGKVVAVDDANLTVEDKEFFVVVGPSGCGKTTLLRLVAGLIRPDEGNIYIGDQCVDDLNPSQRGVRMVFQGYALYPHMKVFYEQKYSNLSFGLRIKRYSDTMIKQVVGRVARRVRVEKRLFDSRPRELSAGQQQRVAVARALTLPPKVLLMDEPLSNLDPPTRVKVAIEIRKLHEELRTSTIYVTHNLAEAMAMADRLAVMREGAILQVGTPEEVQNQPSNEFVADFVKYHDYHALKQDLEKGRLAASLDRTKSDRV